MKKQFVTYEIAKKLKELGFNEPCLAEYYYSPLHIKEKKEPRLLIGDQSSFKESCSVEYYTTSPLWQQAIDWINSQPKLPLFKDHVNYDSNKELLEERILRAIEKIQSVN